MEISNNFNIFWSAFNKPVYIISNYAIKRERKQKLPAALNAVGSKGINKSDTFNSRSRQTQSGVKE